MSKKTNQFDYPHPLIKNLYQTKSYTPQNIAEYLKQKPTFYDTNFTFSPSIKSFISPKILRISNTKIIPDEKFGILMQPFDHTQQVQSFQRSAQNNENWKCKNCNSYLNYQCESISLYEVNCRVCKSVQSISLDVKNTLESVPCCYEVCSEDIKSAPLINQKNICFVIEASQFNHTFRVSEVIESCLNSLKSTQQSNQIQRKFSQAVTQDQDNVQINENIETQANQHTRYNISFMMFNDQNIFVLNQTTNDITVFNEAFVESSPLGNHSVINFDDFFRPIEQIRDQIFELVADILYESYLKSTSCLNVCTKFIHDWIDKYMVSSKRIGGSNGLNQNSQRQVEYKFFINTLKPTKSITEKPASQSSSVNGKQMFSNISNMVASNLTSSKSKQKQLKPTETQEQTESALTLRPNFSFFYLPHYHTKTFISIPQKQVIRKLNNNLYKMYPQTEDQTPKSKMDLFNQLYYDLYEHLSSKQYFNVKLDIICSEKVQIFGLGNQCLGYDDCSSGLVRIQSASQTGKQFNSYTATFKCIDPTNTLPIDLKILPLQNPKTQKQLNSQSQHTIQINLQYTLPLIANGYSQSVKFQRVFNVEVTTLNRAINYQHHIYASLSTYVDDQTLFYFKLRWILSECHKTKTNHTIFKKLFQQMQKLSDNFKNEYGQMDFHKEYVRIFLYSFLIMAKPITNGINQDFYYERHLWLKGSPECIAKSLYPRTYELINSDGKVELKNIKSSPKNFKSNSLVLVDNGKFLYFIIGQDNSVPELKKIFGTCFIDQIRQMTELPELPTNQSYRDAIDLARSLHTSNFLPLKMMELFSRQFDDEVSHLLYKKDNHYKYMRQLWEMEPAPKNIRS